MPEYLLEVYKAERVQRGILPTTKRRAAEDEIAKS